VNFFKKLLSKKVHEHQFGWRDLSLSELIETKENCFFRICSCGAIQILPTGFWPTLSEPDQKIILEKIGEKLKELSPKRKLDVVIIFS
jgi:hypothetical protein